VTPNQPLRLPASARQLDNGELELVERARATIDAATDAGPDEDGVHTMGAAVRATDGSVYVGVNLYHFTGGPCAELVALGSARAGGAIGITHIVAVGNHGRGPVGPCGRDRQVLLDYHPGVRVILPTAQGTRSVTIEELMPLSTRWSPQSGSVPEHRVAPPS
jgi:cytidine deaminase